ncbi:DUF1398 domain-containing protein [Siculibacillus lacustris]|uniref:DUF1398 domain-containing protein n=1 Tax=Siculibacillus lacustris TaxID=1549641 RepID=A0A4Q9VXQ0_9HYPH|nr:DUF1398 domain-containing protein [Siculibacillus lacustris]TBW41267.1 DUF1398 domain-containing protein [Siculibacillus lacustris]
MDAERIAIAEACLNAAHDDGLGFPEIVARLIAAGFEGYTVDYRRNTQTFYLPDGDSLELETHLPAGGVAATFKSDEVGRLVRWAQANPADYGYVGFSQKVKAAGCAGYLVSFLGRRVVYFGRTAETHVEHIPN